MARDPFKEHVDICAKVVKLVAESSMVHSDLFCIAWMSDRLSVQMAALFIV